MTPVTPHARQRIAERDVTDDDIAVALSGKSYEQPSGRTLHYRRRVGVVLSATGEVVTVIKYTKKAVKKKLSW